MKVSFEDAMTLLKVFDMNNVDLLRADQITVHMDVFKTFVLVCHHIDRSPLEEREILSLAGPEFIARMETLYGDQLREANLNLLRLVKCGILFKWLLLLHGFRFVKIEKDHLIYEREKIA